MSISDPPPVTAPARRRRRATFAETIAMCVFAGFVGGGIGTLIAVFALHAVGRL